MVEEEGAPNPAAPQRMHRLRAVVTLLLLALPVLLQGDKKLRMTWNEYVDGRRASVNRKAYERALERMQSVKIGMDTGQFFEILEMRIVKDKKGEALDGYVEGYLQKESLEMTAGKDPDRYLVFGYYRDWPKRTDPDVRFHVVFRHKILRHVVFTDPGEAPPGLTMEAQGQ